MLISRKEREEKKVKEGDTKLSSLGCWEDWEEWAALADSSWSLIISTWTRIPAKTGKSLLNSSAGVIGSSFFTIFTNFS